MRWRPIILAAPNKRGYVSNGIRFTLDEHLRLRLSVPSEFRPLAAWLHTDVQANHRFLAQLIPGLHSAQLSGVAVLGNGWQAEPAQEGILLRSAYLEHEPVLVPDSLLWPVLEGLHGFLEGIDAQLRAENPAPPHDIPRLVEQDETGALRDYTYFPRSWTDEMVTEAGQGAWQSQEVLRDGDTGAWSGHWRGMEIAGYFDPASGEVLTYFPVISPLTRLPTPVG